VREFGWDSVRFLGFKNQTELPAFFDLCDVFVLPSLNEPWALVVNEVMNAGRAVIVSDQVGCATDLVRNGENGFIFKAGDVSALAMALETSMRDGLRTQQMGEASRRIVEHWGFEQDVVGLRHALASFDLVKS
jgi:glycosyltransferase involved in cell wall biosynthesis